MNVNIEETFQRLQEFNNKHGDNALGHRPVGVTITTSGIMHVTYTTTHVDRVNNIQEAANKIYEFLESEK